MPKKEQTVEEEQVVFDAIVKEIEEWWKTPKQAHLKRYMKASTIKIP